MEQVQKILEISQSSEGPLKTADEVEELPIEQMRWLANATMSEWAVQGHLTPTGEVCPNILTVHATIYFSVLRVAAEFLLESICLSVYPKRVHEERKNCCVRRWWFYRRSLGG
jgi:hypothetical protein